MANLKLNSVSLATESGGTVTVDSAVAGIPAAGVTGVLPSAVTDNITTLGTVTTGTMNNTIGSSATFPAGHVVQTTTSVYNTTYTTVTATTTSSDATVVTGSITPLYDNSSILLHANFNCQIHSESSSDCGYALKWYKSASGITDGFPVEMKMTNHNTQAHSTFYRDGFQYGSLSDNYQSTVMNWDCETTNTITYTLYASHYGVDGDLRVGTTLWNNTNWIIYFQEIKR